MLSNCRIAAYLLKRRLLKKGFKDVERVLVPTRRDYWWGVKFDHCFVRVGHHEIGYRPVKESLGKFPPPLFNGRLRFGKY